MFGPARSSPLSVPLTTRVIAVVPLGLPLIVKKPPLLLAVRLSGSVQEVPAVTAPPFTPTLKA